VADFGPTSAVGFGGTMGRGVVADERFPDPFCDVASLSMPESIQTALRWCILPGTPVELADLSLRPIDQVRPGDSVLTRGGTVERVLRYSVRNVEEEIVAVSFSGFGRRRPLKLTGNHQLWRIPTNGKKPSAIEIRPDKTEKVRADLLQVGDYVATPIPARQAIQPSRYDGWLIGMYLAEGCVCRDGERVMRVRFTCGEADERSGVLARLVEELQAATGELVTVYTPPSRPDVRLVTVSDVEMPDWVATHCPGLARNKQLSDTCLTWSDNTILGVIGGLIDGDGNCSQTRGVFRDALIWSTSYTMLYQLQRLSQLVGLCPTLCERNANHLSDAPSYCLKYSKTDCQRLEAYSLKVRQARRTLVAFKPAKGATASAFVRDGYVFRRITAVTRESYAGPVHNFEVEHDHSYIAGGVTVANCEYIMNANGVYRQAVDRVVSYFITDVEINDIGENTVGQEEKEKFRVFLEDTLAIKNVLHTVAMDYLTYGNSFTSLLLPFRRYLSCKQCGLEMPLEKVHSSEQCAFKWENFEFHATCPKCKKTGVWRHVDRRSGENSGVSVKRWSPHEIEILWDPYSTECQYVWKIPEDYRNQIKAGHLHYLKNASWEVVQAVKSGNNLMFDKDVIYHLKEDALSGMRNRGWGISRVLTNFRQAWYVQILLRYNEAIALDYVIPFRVLTPEPRGGDPASGDPVHSINLSGFSARVQAMVRARRTDPARWNVLPFPVKYQALGGDASQLAPRDLIDQGQDTLLKCIGMPIELFNGTLTFQAAPAALRLFEANWGHLPHNLNLFLRNLVEVVARNMSWEPVSAKLMRVTHADDLNRQMAKLQLMQGQQISKTTGLKSVGLDYEEETKRMLEEEKIYADEQQRMQEEMQQSQQMQAMSQPANMMAGVGDTGSGATGQPAGGDPSQGGGAPPQGGGGGAAPGQPPGLPGQAPSAVDQFIMQRQNSPNVPRTPEELQTQAQLIANDLLAKPESLKDAELIKLKRADPTMHSLVRSIMDDIRQQARAQGGAAVMAQTYGQGGGAPQ
jgi:hypothetical protein